jgi:hypothetical protein
VTKHIQDCQTSNELAEAIEYHLKEGGMRRSIYEQGVLKRTVFDDFETRRLYGTALNQYNEIRKSNPKLSPLQLDTSEPLSGLAQIQRLCEETEQDATSNKKNSKLDFFYKLYEKTLKALFSAIIEAMKS